MKQVFAKIFDKTIHPLLFKSLILTIVAMVVGARPHWLLPFAIVGNLRF